VARCTSVIPASKKLRQGDCEFKASLDYPGSQNKIISSNGGAHSPLRKVPREKEAVSFSSSKQELFTRVVGNLKCGLKRSLTGIACGRHT
jgi:hypothetical protein